MTPIRVGVNVKRATEKGPRFISIIRADVLINFYTETFIEEERSEFFSNGILNTIRAERKSTKIFKW